MFGNPITRDRYRMAPAGAPSVGVQTPCSNTGPATAGNRGLGHQAGLDDVRPSRHAPTVNPAAPFLAGTRCVDCADRVVPGFCCPGGGACTA